MLNSLKVSQKAGQILSKGDNLAFSGGNEIIGRGIQRGSTTIEEMTNAKIILKKDANGKFILIWLSKLINRRINMLLKHNPKDEIYQFLAGNFHQDSFYEEVIQELIEEEYKRIYTKCYYFLN